MPFANFRTQKMEGKWKKSSWWTQTEYQNDFTINWNNRKLSNVRRYRECHSHSQLKPIKWIINEWTNERVSINLCDNKWRQKTFNIESKTAIDTNEINIWLFNEPQLITHKNYWMILCTMKGVSLSLQLIHNSFFFLVFRFRIWNTLFIFWFLTICASSCHFLLN